MKRIIVSVTNDLATDNRMIRVCSSLVRMGLRVELVGRLLKSSLSPGKTEYKTTRIRLFFNKGMFFYAEFNIRLFFYLLFSKADIFLSNDLDTLPANFLAAKLRRKHLVFDSHELFTEVPELIHRPFVRKFWLRIEKQIIPEIKFAYTVSESIASVYRERYGTHFRVIRNVPFRLKNMKSKSEAHANTEKTVLYQGSLNEGRGLECAIMAMKFLDHTKLIIAGDGDISQKLKDLANNENLSDKVTFTGRLSPESLKELTLQADLGLSVEEDRGLNYRYALPNKLFDYIQAGIPVLVSDLPEMAALVGKWQTGLVTPSHEPEILAGKIWEALTNEDQRKKWKDNLLKAAEELNWENEELKLKEIFRPLI